MTATIMHPVTFYESLEELPEFTDYSMRGRTYRYMEGKAQYPFGYGLTYGDVRVLSAKITDGTACVAAMDSMSSGNTADTGAYRNSKSVRLEVEAENCGAMDTDEVLQIYVKNTESDLAVKNTSLYGFKRIHLKAGEKRAYSLEVDPDAFTVIDEDGKRVDAPGYYELYIGCSQPDGRSIELTGVSPLKTGLDKS